ncbi:MAG: hypothetical protein HYX74_09025 [Acidobacteria bacterium]|nr:hypothetical protein [Acidobacteriota bacterium]
MNHNQSSGDFVKGVSAVTLAGHGAEYAGFACAMLYFCFQACLGGNLLFSQVADGGGFATTFILANTGTSTASGTLRFINSNGTPRSIQVSGVGKSEIPVTIPVGGTARLRTDNAGDAAAGWALFESADPVAGVAVFDLRGPGGGLLTSAAVLGGKAHRLVQIPVEVGASTNTGVAIANPDGSSGVTVRLHLWSDTGVPAATVSDPRLNALGPQGHVADFATAFFSSVQGINNFRGALIIEVVGAGGVSVVGLSVREGLLTTLPVIELSDLPVAPPGPPPPDYDY